MATTTLTARDAFAADTAAKLAYEQANDAQYRLLTEGLCSMVGRGFIAREWKAWQMQLRETLDIHRRVRRRGQYKEWWEEKVGTLGARKLPLTRKRIAESKGILKAWSITL